MRSPLRFIIPLVLLIAIGAGVYWYHSSGTSPTEVGVAQKPVSAGDAAEPVPQYPVDAKEGASGTYSSNTHATGAQSEDGESFEKALQEFFGPESFNAVFSPASLIRKIVVTIDNLQGSTQPKTELLPLRQPDSDFLSTEKQGSFSISPENDHRYDSYIQAIQSADAQKMVALYAEFYPMFQKAYRELGTNKYFNYRLIKVVDHLLETPDLQGPIMLTKADQYGRFRFADEQLENLSTGQKLLVRIGSHNREIIKMKLRQVRELLAQLGKHSAKSR